LKLEADPEQLERMRKQIAENCQPRQATQARMGNSANLSNKIIDGVLDYLANKKGGLTQLNDAVKEARSNWARHAAKALWEKRPEQQPASPPRLTVVSAKRPARRSKYG
jgi:hypothetical protein